MRIEIEQLHIKVTRDDGATLAFALDDAGLTVTVDRLEIEVNEDARMTVTVPFEEQASA